VEYVLGLVITMIGGVSIYELYAWLPHICKWLIKQSTKIISEDERERYSEEWHAHLANTPNSLIKMSASIGFIFAALQIRLDEENEEEEVAREFFMILWCSFCGLIRINKDETVTFIGLKIVNYQTTALERKIEHQHPSRSKTKLNTIKARLENIDNRHANQNIWLGEICSRIETILPKLTDSKFEVWHVQLSELKGAMSGIIQNQPRKTEDNPTP